MNLPSIGYRTSIGVKATGQAFRVLASGGFLRIGRCWIFCLAFFGCPLRSDSADTPTLPIDQAGYEAIVEPLFEEYCTKCHGPDDAEGDFRLDNNQLGLAFNQSAAAMKWREVANVLNSHEMPPKEEPQPDAEAVAKLVDWVRDQQIRADQFDRKNKVVLRRLNRNEYKNTIHDLVGIDYDVSRFPQDPPAAGFDNNGRALSSSPLQVELYLDAAQAILDEALVVGDRPGVISWRFEPETGDSDSNRVRYGEYNAIVNGGANRLDGNTRVMHHNSWDRTINARDFAVPIAGTYTIGVRAGSIIPSRDEVVRYAERVIREQRGKEMIEQPNRRNWIEQHLEEEIDYFRKSRIFDYGPGRLRVIVHHNGQPETIGEFDVDASKDAMKEFQLPVKMITAKTSITLEYAYHIPPELENFAIQRQDEFPRPEVMIDWFEIKGPIYDDWPPTSHQRLIDKPIPTVEADRRKLAQAILTRFMPRAFRRPVSPAEIEEKMILFENAASSIGTSSLTDETFISQIKAPLVAVLVSPNFLYLAEPYRTASTDTLTQFEVASRLSYFLWSSMPDDALLRAAANQELSDPANLISQVDRMLADARVSAFHQNFAGQWFGLRDVGSNPPAEDLYVHYGDHIQTSIVRQSLALFDDVLRNDRDMLELVDSDHEMLNEVLSRYYELPPVKGDEMRRVELAENSHRGGILTHASMLTTTSNGTRTSPVKRGTWILKNIFGTDPGLPVANAGDIAPKVPGIDKATVRNRLEIHRQLAQCARCHRKIDPLGFALENYDASGRYRRQEGFGYKGRIEKADPVIDASGELPDGTKINGVEDLKAAVRKNDALFIRCVADKMFTYAIGREMLTADSEVIDKVVATLIDSKSTPHRRTLRMLIHQIVTSPIFSQR